jgi:hypothetical protein
MNVRQFSSRYKLNFSILRIISRVLPCVLIQWKYGHMHLKLLLTEIFCCQVNQQMNEIAQVLSTLKYIYVNQIYDDILLEVIVV